MKKLSKLSTGKRILLCLAALFLWYFSFHGILYSILRPDWDEVTLIASYDMHGNYTEYTEDNGRALAEEALSGIWLGPPWFLNLYAVWYASGANPGMTVIEIHTEDEVRRVCFTQTSGTTRGFVHGAGEIAPYFYAGDKFREMLTSGELQRTRDFRPEGCGTPGYWNPRYRWWQRFLPPESGVQRYHSGPYIWK